MFILTFQSYSDIPQKRSEFYNQVFDTLFSFHDSMSKMAYVREKLSGLSKEQFEEVLKLFSFISFFEEIFIFPSNYLSDKLNVIKSKKKNLIFDNDKFIQDLQVAIGILNKEGLDYVFPHRSLQEYFAASYIEKLGDQNKKGLYQKLKKEIKKNYSILILKANFYDLLSEIDYKNCCNYLSIPLVEDLYKRIKLIKDIDDNIAYSTYGKLLLNFHFLLKTKDHHTKIHHQIISNEISFTIIHGPNNELELPAESDRIDHTPLLESLNLPIMRERVIDFKKYGDRIIEELKKTIDEIDKSDQEIINLI